VSLNNCPGTQNISLKYFQLRNPKLIGINIIKSAINEFTQNQCCLIEITNDIINATSNPIKLATVDLNINSNIFDADKLFSSKAALVMGWFECLKNSTSLVSVKYEKVSNA
jgi:hypothetical protein